MLLWFSVAPAGILLNRVGTEQVTWTEGEKNNTGPCIVCLGKCFFFELSVPWKMQDVGSSLQGSEEAEALPAGCVRNVVAYTPVCKRHFGFGREGVTLG